jgi:hypothetical protein
MDELAEKVANGQASEEEHRRLNALRDEVELPFSDHIENADEWLNRFESTLAKLETLDKRADERLREINDK